MGPKIDPLTRAGIQAANQLQAGIFQGGSDKLKNELSDLRQLLNNITEQTELLPSYKCNFYSFNRLLAKENCANKTNNYSDILNLNTDSCPYVDVVPHANVLSDIEKLAKSIENYVKEEEEKEKEKEIDYNTTYSLVQLFVTNQEANLDKLLPHLIKRVESATYDLTNTESEIISKNRDDVIKLVNRFKSLQKVIENIPRKVGEEITSKKLLSGITEDEKKSLYNADPKLSLDRLYEVYMQLKPTTNEETGYHETLRSIKYEQIYSSYRAELNKSNITHNEYSTIRSNATLYKGGFLYLYGNKVKEDFIRSACNISGLSENSFNFDNDIDNLMKMCVHNQSVFFYNVDIDDGEINKNTNQHGADFFNEVCSVFKHDTCQEAGLRMPASCEKTGESKTSWTDEDIRKCEETHYNLYCDDKEYQDIDTMLGKLKQNKTGKYFCGMSDNDIKLNVTDKFVKALNKYKNEKDSEFNGCKPKKHYIGSDVQPDFSTDGPKQNPEPAGIGV